MPVKPLDSLLAIKVLNLIEGLRPSDRRVATTLIEHYNRKTGRCDPSLGRLAELLGLSTRTIIRATNRLEQARLFRKARHGGLSHRNLYQPNWNRFAELEAAWRQRFRSLHRSTELSPSCGHESHAGSDSDVNQTCPTNLKQETYSGCQESKKQVRTISQPASRSFAVSTSASDTAAVAAERRWAGALHRTFAGGPITYGEIIEAIDPAMREAATRAEMNHRGAGLQHILRTLKLAGPKC